MAVEAECHLPAVQLCCSRQDRKGPGPVSPHRAVALDLEPDRLTFFRKIVDNIQVHYIIASADARKIDLPGIRRGRSAPSSAGVLRKLWHRRFRFPTSILASAPTGNIDNGAVFEKQPPAAIDLQYLGYQLWPVSPQCITESVVQRRK